MVYSSQILWFPKGKASNKCSNRFKDFNPGIYFKYGGGKMDSKGAKEEQNNTKTAGSVFPVKLKVLY